MENAAENPVLRIINDPAGKLAAEPVINIVRFKVPVEEWKGKGVVAGEEALHRGKFSCWCGE